MSWRHSWLAPAQAAKYGRAFRQPARRSWPRLIVDIALYSGATILGTLFLAAALFFMVMVLSKPSWSHEWLDGKKNAAGELCCSPERDCVEILAARVEHRRGFYLVHDPESRPGMVHYMDKVPESEALPSPDDSYWRCAWGGTRKCFFAPRLGS